MMMQPYVYFMANKSKDEIRIGSSSSGEHSRLATHKKYGHKTLAVIPATKQHEENLHTWFEKYKIGRDNSHYEYNAVFPYVERLLEFNWASGNENDIEKMSPQPWNLWSPEALTKPLFDRDQACLLVTEGVRSAVNDTWQTPQEIADICRQALGGKIDLDPASDFEANKRIRAEYFYYEKLNGLIRPWHGSVFLNPPYGGEREPMAERFIDKLIYELAAGHVVRALTVLNLQSIPTLWFPKVREHAVCHAIWAKRIDFIGPKAKSGSGAKAFSSSKNGTIFSFFGGGAEAFQNAFKSYAMVIREVNDTHWDKMWTKPFDKPELVWGDTA